jgi:hypothetical protein
MKSGRNVAFLHIAIFSTLLISHCANAQLMSSAKPGPLDPYRECFFQDGLQLVQIDSLASGVAERSVETTEGSKAIKMLAGNRLLFAYPGTNIFANTKAEQLPSTTWDDEKKLLIENFTYLLHSSPDFSVDSVTNRDLLSLRGQGMTKNSLSGGVLAFYLLFDNSRHVATTIYLVNQDPSSRKFQSLGEFRTLESRFLDTYAACLMSGNH